MISTSGKSNDWRK